ncbi:hypothetical protein HZB94_03165 [Candidatus Falkowbacteria bacterium]|nr:hypothetical protein [Candidatus Falkowbacteria bacterium]
MKKGVYIVKADKGYLISIPPGTDIEVACSPSPNYFVLALKAVLPDGRLGYLVYAGHEGRLRKIPVDLIMFNGMIDRLALHAKHLQVAFTPKDIHEERRKAHKVILPPSINCQQQKPLEYEVAAVN